MSSPPDTRPSSSSAVRHPARRLLAVVLVCCVVLFTWYYLRGTWATTSPVYPSSPDEGVKSVIVLNDQGSREIQTAVLLPVPVETAWSILSNYAEWERLFPTIRRLGSETKVLDKDRHHVVSDVMTPLGILKLDFIVTHEKTSDGGFIASWNAPTAELPVNEGAIRVTPRGPQLTLLVYTVHKQYREYPQFMVYNKLLGHQTDLVGTLSTRILEAAGER